MASSIALAKLTNEERQRRRYQRRKEKREAYRIAKFNAIAKIKGTKTYDQSGNEE